MARDTEQPELALLRRRVDQHGEAGDDREGEDGDETSGLADRVPTFRLL